MGRKSERGDTCTRITDSLCCKEKLTQHCKATIFPKKLIKKKKRFSADGFSPLQGSTVKMLESVHFQTQENKGLKALFTWPRCILLLLSQNEPNLSDYCCCLVTMSCPTLFAAPCPLPRLLVRGTSQTQILEGLPFPSPRDFPDPGREPTSPASAGEFLTTEPPGKP